MKTLPTSGELRTFCSISSAHGVEVSSSFRALARKIPKNSSGKLIGQLHCLGATQICARGNFLENGPTKILCSYAKVGRTMCSTGASNSFKSWNHKWHKMSNYKKNIWNFSTHLLKKKQKGNQSATNNIRPVCIHLAHKLPSYVQGFKSKYLQAYYADK